MELCTECWCVLRRRRYRRYRWALVLSDQQTAAAHRQTGVSGDASKCPFTQNNLYVFRMYFKILVCFSFLESKVGATERRYTGQHVQFSEFSKPPLQKHLPYQLVTRNVPSPNPFVLDKMPKHWHVNGSFSCFYGGVSWSGSTHDRIFWFYSVDLEFFRLFSHFWSSRCGLIRFMDLLCGFYKLGPLWKRRTL